ncbi:hypothetical protein OROMI_003392 [Orobanche minor]
MANPTPAAESTLPANASPTPVFNAPAMQKPLNIKFGSVSSEQTRPSQPHPSDNKVLSFKQALLGSNNSESIKAINYVEDNYVIQNSSS